MAALKRKKPTRAPAKRRIVKPAAAGWAPKTLKEVADHCTSGETAEPALKEYIARGRSLLRTG